VAVYTLVAAEDIAALLSRYDVGTLVSAKGIAEGVENSNYLIETTGGRFILTLYEKRVDAADLPFFIAVLDHLAMKGNPVPRAIRDRNGFQVQTVAGRPACLIEFLPGVSVTRPGRSDAHAAGAALGRLHWSLADFRARRDNSMGLPGWRHLAEQCGTAIDKIRPRLAERIAAELAFLEQHWPAELAHSIIHADLFPDNVLMLDGQVTGIIDFYFAAYDIRAWDVAVTHAAWCFDDDGAHYNAARGAALIAGYEAGFGLSHAERTAFPVLCRGAALRFLLTRAWDWLNTPADAMVTRKNPLAFLSRLDFYATASPKTLLGA